MHRYRDPLLVALYFGAMLVAFRYYNAKNGAKFEAARHEYMTGSRVIFEKRASGYFEGVRIDQVGLERK